MDIEFNDANLLDTQGTGWFIGYGDWIHESSPLLRYMPPRLRSQTLSMKWMQHRKGDPGGADKPPSEGRTISLLVSECGRFRLQFSDRSDFPKHGTVEHVLEKQGHFSVWGEGIYHRWFVDEDCLLLTLRWIPERMRI